MELAALLAKLLGPTFARFLFAYALRGKIELDFISSGDVAETLADSLDIGAAVDRLSGGDRRATRNAPHIFETIGDDVAEQVAAQIAALLVQENVTLAEGEVEQAVDAAKAVMNRRALPLLVETRLNRIHFRQELSATRPPAAAGWSEAIESLYRRLLATSSDYLFAAAEQIPHFTRDTTAQLLQDTNHLLEGMRLGLANQQRILDASYAVQRRGEGQQFERDYRTALSSALDKLRLFGVPLVDGARQPLSVAFVKMRLVHTEREEDGEDLPGFPKPGRPEARSEILSVAQAFSRSPRLVVVAPAGLGKTTLLRWAAVQMARHNPDGEIPGWQDRVPFFVQLRDYSHKPLPAIADLPQAFQSDGMELLAGAAPEGWAREQMRAKRAALFLDGLDEINEAKRQEALAWVENLLALDPELVVVLSGRPAAVDRESAQPELTRLGFDFVGLQPLDEEQIDAFVRRWHAAMADESCKYPDKSRIPAREARLRAALAQRGELGQLATTPLLAAMLCALNLTEDRELPRDRIRLYNRCVDMLLDRDAARGVDTSGYGINLRPASARRHLGEIAFWMLEREQSTIEQTDAARLIAKWGLDGELIARYLAERSGLLQPQSQEVYDFAHRTFQEFLAAQHIATSHRVVQVVKQYAGQKAWRETITLLAGFVEFSDQKDLLEALLDTAQKKPNEARSCHLLAWAFWELLDQRTDEANGLMTRHATGLGPNDERILYLDDLQVADMTPLIVLTSLQELHLLKTPVVDVTPLTMLTSLQKLTLQDTQVRDVKPLAQLTNLEYLSLHGMQIGDLAPLAGLTGLRTLALSETKVMDLVPLSGLTNLEELYLVRTPVSDVAPLVGLASLKKVSLGSTRVGDLAPLAGLTNLQILYLWNTDVTEVTTLAKLTGLQELDLSNTRVGDIMPLAGLTSLQYLNVRNTRVSDLSALSERIGSGELTVGLSKKQVIQLQHYLNGLTRLSLEIREIDDVRFLEQLTSLQTLDLRNTQVGDVTPLAGLTGLQTLDLRNTQVVDVTPLAGLTSLQSLYLSSTQVEDVTPLAGLTSLQSLYLSYTQIKNITPLAGLTSLQELDLRNTQVTDLSPLAKRIASGRLLIGLDEAQITALRDHLNSLSGLGLSISDVDDIQFLAGLTSLQRLDLSDTQVVDVTPLAGLTSLQTLDLRNTRVTDVSALSHLENLRIIR